MPDVAANAAIQKQARIIRDMLDTEAWRTFEATIKEQIRTREAILMQPLHDVPNPNSLDFLAKAASMEAVKGTIIGLKLALDLPRIILDHSKDISRQAEAREENTR